MSKVTGLRAPEITIDQAIEICQESLPERPKLGVVITRIKELREERDMFRGLAHEYAGEAAWGRSSLKERLGI